ncbi:hypothetical protein LPB19_12020 [Marinobacter salinisoli]|uniref:Metallothionein n=1 Tax=Marinobacter salinisoli TaxID=2769486 RepID=A0ABX7MP54_9GAMM|nr:hypothetical protein LPB19_12020 [Marinobacter salinisoli]
MTDASADGTYQCAREECNCRVADDETHYKTATGIFCCKECSEGKGCHHSGCNCGTKGGS